MERSFGGFETYRVPYFFAQVIIGWPMTAWAFLVWSFNVLALRRNPFGKFTGTLSIMEPSPALRRIRAGSAGWEALHIIYNWYGHFGIRSDLPRDPLAWFWIQDINAQAVRNRLRIIVDELKKAILETSGKEDEVRIFSIASGSAQSIFLAVKALRQEGFTKRVKLLLLDLDHTALEHSLELAAELGFPRKDIITANSTTSSIEKLVERYQFKPSIVEMAGLMDYLHDRKAVLIMKRIYRLLPPGGWFLTCHIHPNMGRHFLRWAFCWAMLYRKKENFLSLVKRAGDWEVKAITEPHGVHTVAVCRKG